MKEDLSTLVITPHELERICGLEVNELFIGGMISGVLRSSVLNRPMQLLSLLLVEVSTSGLLLIFSLPISFAMTRNIDLHQASGAQYFLGMTLGLSIGMLILWNALMILRARKFRLLMGLLDEIDRFNALISAVQMLNRLDRLKPESGYFENHPEIVNALNITRDSLISGMMTEKILRENRNLLSRCQDLLNHIETNLSALSVLAIRDEASDYSRILNEALQIGTIVQREMQHYRDT